MSTDPADGAQVVCRLVLATANQGKVSEIRQLLGDRYEVVARPADLAETIEDGETLEANALKKAREVAASANALAVADDTGLFVDALDGRPGVHSARYASPEADDEANIDKLLSELAEISEDGGRRAAFRTVMAAVWPEGNELLVEGMVTGHISQARRGSAGFGYDPVFVPAEGDGRTFAQMTGEEKNRISHRGRAVAGLVAALVEGS
ncbi:MAG: RdgB/HAM1 family non-canonical purine NTP pyrophosphatase [Actinomycetia bacterium]|nr:RdgB/HAM1 family non-canonical purine NTP pyrophosphatase [Actinomycetes bacterium]MCP4227433.1 RdgB/HAM1 family non-canonical purine NTP pyrophosphatase [Actinomycetes bacterium]MCP5033671.1 RdgB/HAM1 family non-canonical purine NTP pyrophosphatase [Actinomycetes bacterium]